MNNKIYYFINDADYAEICYSSYDKSLLEEIMYDEFFNDVICETYYRSRIYDSIEEIKSIFNETWEDMLCYYNDYIHIEESEII